MRYEIKYALSVVDLGIIKQAIINHPFSFTTAFANRIVNNIYFDTPELNWFYQNLNGDPNRTKLRYRWYDEEKNIGSGKFEIKLKRNLLGDKKYINQSFSSYEDLERYMPDQEIFPFLIKPTLKNKYSRSYWISADTKFRITLDTNLTFEHTEHSTLLHTEEKIILEIKFAKEDYVFFDELNKFLPFRQTKFSKYATGISKLYF